MSDIICASAPRCDGASFRLPFGIGYFVFERMPRPVEMVARMTARLSRILSNRSAVAQLSAMDDRMLSDIGLTRGDVAAAADLGAFGHPMTVLDIRAAERSVCAVAPGERGR